MRASKQRPSKLYVVSWGPDSRHLHESVVHQNILAAREHYQQPLGKAKKLVRIVYQHRMSEGDSITILKEQIA